jgi:hypothetical protein
MTDEQLLARLHSPPDLRDGIESLAYWHERRKRVSWYRIRARREASQMAARWEERVRGALVRQRGVAFETRVSAGLMLGRIVLRRWGRRLALVVTATIALAVMAAPLLGALVLLSQLF